jgi:hypothetical protein
MSVSRSAPLFLSDGTPVTFVKVTSRGNFQVRLPDGHAFAEGQENGRIFSPTSGRHYKGRTDLTLTNEAPVAASAPAVGPVNPNLPMFLNDGTPVTLSKVTRRGRIQVVLPASHPAAAGQENGWLFEAATGGRYKGRDPSITLTNTASAVAAATPAEDATYAIAVNGSVLNDGLASYEVAEGEAIAALNADTRQVTILKVSTSVAGVVGIAATRS